MRLVANNVTAVLIPLYSNLLLSRIAVQSYQLQGTRRLNDTVTAATAADETDSTAAAALLFVAVDVAC